MFVTALQCFILFDFWKYMNLQDSYFRMQHSKYLKITQTHILFINYNIIHKTNEARTLYTQKDTCKDGKLSISKPTTIPQESYYLGYTNFEVYLS